MNKLLIKHNQGGNKMTNNMIIMLNSIEAMEEGLLKGSGIFGEVTTLDENDEEVTNTIELPEEINTFIGWKRRGYTVKRGEKAKLQFPIWVKCKKSKKSKKSDETEVENSTEENEAGKSEKKKNRQFYLKNAFWFTIDQCEPIKA